jgi:hypothetical protein
MARKIPYVFRFAPYGTTVGTYALYLVLLPFITARFVPCLSTQFGVSYEYSRCNVTLALDRFLMLTLIGLGIVQAALFYMRKKRTLAPFVITGCICTILAIAAFHLYIPYAEGLVRRAPILLESLR